MSLTVHLALVFHVFIAVAVMVMICGRHGIGPCKEVSKQASKPFAVSPQDGHAERSLSLLRVRSSELWADPWTWSLHLSGVHLSPQQVYRPLASDVPCPIASPCDVVTLAARQHFSFVVITCTLDPKGCAQQFFSLYYFIYYQWLCWIQLRVCYNALLVAVCYFYL